MRETYRGAHNNQFGNLLSKNHRYQRSVVFLTDSIAPADCLQYFTSATGQIKSFNWQDVAGTATRQLNNQNYNICFRTELVSSQVCIIRYISPLVNRI
jgi:hypothetical protein